MTILEPQTPARTSVSFYADMLDAAADVIDRDGWSTDGCSLPKVCAAMAITAAVLEAHPGTDLSYLYYPIAQVVDVFGRSLGFFDGHDVPAWNDRQPNAQVVTDALRSAAIACRSGLL